MDGLPPLGGVFDSELSAEDLELRYGVKDVDRVVDDYDGEDVVLVGQEPDNPAHDSMEDGLITALQPEYVLWPVSREFQSAGPQSTAFYDRYVDQIGPFTTVSRIQQYYEGLGFDRFPDYLEKIPNQADAEMPPSWRDVHLGDSEEIALPALDASYNRVDDLLSSDVGPREIAELQEHIRLVEALYTLGPFSLTMSFDRESMAHRDWGDELDMHLPVAEAGEQQRTELWNAAYLLGSVHDVRNGGRDAYLGNIGIYPENLESHIDSSNLPEDRSPEPPETKDGESLEEKLEAVSHELTKGMMKRGDHRSIERWNEKSAVHILDFRDERGTDRPVLAILNDHQMDPASMRERLEENPVIDDRSFGVPTVTDLLEEMGEDPYTVNLVHEYPVYRREELFSDSVRDGFSPGMSL